MSPILLFGAGLIVARILTAARSVSGSVSARQGRGTPADLAAYYRMSPAERVSAPPVPGGGLFTKQKYEPQSADAIALFSEAARLLGPSYDGWGDARGIHYTLGRESGGFVGVPNSAPRDPSTWPPVWAAAKALQRNANPYGSEYIGLGQLGTRGGDWSRWTEASANDMPRGPASLGVPLEEAIGMLRYVKGRYGTPEVLWEWYHLPYAPGCTSVRDPSDPTRWIQPDPAQCDAYKNLLREKYGSANPQNAIREGFRYHHGY
jgi:hypothetical protein